MNRKECVAMILAGGRGERLGSLTSNVAKPAVIFGGKYRIIDFTLNNCKASKIDTVGVLTQYLPAELHKYIKNSNATSSQCEITLLPSKTNAKYSGTADAIYKNIQFIDQYNPNYVLILSGDHVYEMDYHKMLEFHKENNADVTIASMPVPFHEASRFGILNAAKDGLITHFVEKPQKPKSNLASMGVYIFRWDCLKKYLIADSYDRISSHDFGKDIIPKMLCGKDKLFAYTFGGYWRDIGTVYSLWAANMDIVHTSSSFVPFNDMSELVEVHRSFELDIRQSIIADYRQIRGAISNSIISDKVSIGEGSIITDCVIMPNVTIGKNVRLSNAIVGAGASIMDNAEVGTDNINSIFAENPICTMGVSLIAPHICISRGLKFRSNSHVDKSPPAKSLAPIIRNRVRIPVSTIHTTF